MQPTRSLMVCMVFGIALASLARFGVARAQTVPVNRCADAKAQCVGKHAKTLLRCHERAENRGATVDPTCVQKAADKLLACVTKAEVKLPCLTLSDGPALANATDAYVQYVVPKLDPGYPAPIVNKCSALKKRAVGDTTARRLGCLSRAFKKAPGTVDPACLEKAEAKLVDGLAHAESKPPCLTTGDAGTLETSIDMFFAEAVAALTGAGAGCGNGQNDVGEACDVSAPSWGWSGCGPGFFCSACTCTSPTRYEITLDATDPSSVLDLGWSGLGHRQELSTDNTITLDVSGCSGGSVRPSGTCTLAGPVPNRVGKIDNRRCTNDTAIRCTSDAPCTAGGGTCEYFLGSWHPRGGYGLSACISHQLDGPVGGAVEVETGELTVTARVKRRNYAGLSIDTPCPRCLNDVSLNDGIADGICSGGARNGQPCDGNATAPSYPDFGVTSLDCPPNLGGFIAELTLPLTSSTQQVVQTVTASSPNCSGAPGEKCLCDTCNNANAEPCTSNADCPTPPGPIGPICGGVRCMGGANNGTPCTASSACPGGVCGRLGEPTKTSRCLDDPATPGVLDCADTAPVDGEGECLQGPTVSSCTLASGHPQRGCLSDADCGGGAGTCEIRNATCFLTGSAAGFGVAGTGTLAADGVADPPTADVAHPTLAAVGCVGPTAYAPLNNVSGFPGPLRFTQKATTTALP